MQQGKFQLVLRLNLRNFLGRFQAKPMQKFHVETKTKITKIPKKPEHNLRKTSKAALEETFKNS